ncbi:thymidylate synthase [Streptosporangium subroseum]|uniref:thymidylate synthase n=1 Tax=Streptosporangium subroseum TaxID=106412 RepID=UPI0034229E35
MFPTFHDAYLAVLQQVLTRPQYQTSSRGNQSLECLNVSFALADPRQRTPNLAARRTNIIFNHAEALWYLAGRDDAAMIGYYAPRLHALAADGHRLTGTAYGPRLFGPQGNSQWDHAVELLTKEPDSKRATMMIMRADEFANPANPDVACTLALQFLIRDGCLHTVCFMRGNDAVLGLLCDVFSFTFLAEFTALQLGIQLGTYTHHVASMHANEPDLPRVRAILAETSPSPPAAVMPADTTWHTVRQVLDWEEGLRINQRRLYPNQIPLLPFDPYWRRVVALLETYRQIIHQPQQPIEADILAVLDPHHRQLIAHRWPEHIPLEER